MTPATNPEREQEADESRPRYLATVTAAAEPGSAALLPPGDTQPRASVVSPWLTYAQAAEYTGWTVAYLRNLVSAGAIPVFGKPRVRRFRRDMLDEYLTDPDAAMRAFRAGRNRHGG
jgi:excisionase family DNA binding protein